MKTNVSQHNWQFPFSFESVEPNPKPPVNSHTLSFDGFVLARGEQTDVQGQVILLSGADKIKAEIYPYLRGWW